MNYSIGQVSEQLGVPIDTLKYYDKQGLLPFVKRDNSGRRRFSDNDVHLMRTIVCLKNAGVSIADISKFIQLRLVGDSTLEQRADLLNKHEKELRQQINDLQETLSYLKFKKWYYDTAVEAGTESVHFVDGTNEVKPNIDEEYVHRLKTTDQLSELQSFLNVKDYRNKSRR
ncbi:MerR family transcriptional regulator [Paucilactobacillus suebicus]|uniref:Transcription regulator n=1 Tax=Paucilactobacillus suebicus DSM 5007 = KCTC 3549 TaxID=1423807 RepID=A0A0R1W681_9LACO|nr:MerR family transcriptional regulator [Paucilactobacillus suebicus]KRM11177.1 transcription regulator [Paucilactobacillus suebicus DSM 5007 = KCTC 3549]